MSNDIEIATGTAELVNRETGELIHVDQITKKTKSMKHFWKMYLADFLAVLGIIDSKQLDVFIYIADNTSPSNNIFMGTQQEIAEAVGCARGTVNTILGKLQKQGFVKKIHGGVYFVNPNIMMRGNDNKRQMLITWEREDFASSDSIAMIRGERKAIEQTAVVTQRPELSEADSVEKELIDGQA